MQFDQTLLAKIYSDPDEFGSAGVVYDQSCSASSFNDPDVFGSGSVCVFMVSRHYVPTLYSPSRITKNTPKKVHTRRW